MITEYEVEPIPGLPGLLPPGEQIVWQGSPDRKALARYAFHTRLVAGYFVALGALAAITSAVRGGGLIGIALTVGLGIVGVALLHVLAWATARSTIYTLTNKRIVLRIGVALPKCINLPLGLIGAVDLTTHKGGTGDVALAVNGAQRLGYAQLWPHTRPWRVATPQPMLRAVPDAASIGATIARACLTAQPEERIAVAEPVRPTPAFDTAVAA